jgi:hypothetical protein
MRAIQFVSICFNRDTCSKKIHESESQSKKQFDPRISIDDGISRSDDIEKL